MPEKLNFKQIAETIDIADVAAYLGIKFVKDRAHCPTCDSERALELKPETNSFLCYKGQPRSAEHKFLSGDCIGLYAHIRGYEGMYRAAKELSEHFLSPTNAGTAPSTAPKKTEGRNQPASPPSNSRRAPENLPKEFDPAAFAAKLVYSEEVKNLSFTEAEAERFGVGSYRGRVYIPVRDEEGTIAGYVGLAKGEIKMPPSWLPKAAPGKVVQFPKRA